MTINLRFEVLLLKNIITNTRISRVENLLAGNNRLENLTPSIFDSNIYGVE